MVYLWATDEVPLVIDGLKFERSSGASELRGFFRTNINDWPYSKESALMEIERIQDVLKDLHSCVSADSGT